MLTVVLPNFNHARFLPYALDALLGQTLPADEIIVIDDASTDNSVEIVESYCRVNSGIKLIVNRANQGVVANMNDGLAIAKHDYVFFAAADDVVRPRLFETAIRLLQEHPEAALFSARSDIIDPEGRSLGVFATPTPPTKAGYISPECAARQLIRDDSWFMGNTTIYRRDALAAAGGFPLELGAFTDGYVSRLLALRHGACFSSEVLGSWRRMEGGVAWEQSTNEDATNKLIDLAERRMRGAKVFPEEYVQRWKRRHLFSARRFMLSREFGRGNRNAARLLWKGLATLKISWLFLKLRPWDIATVARRRAFDKPAQHGSGRDFS